MILPSHKIRNSRASTSTHLSSARCLRATIRLGIIAVLLVTVSACQPEPTTEAPAAQTIATDSVLSADSVMIQYDVRGSGNRALVFIHCWCCDRTFWDGQADVFSSDYRVITLDLAGHGESGYSRDDWTMEAYGADVAAVVETVNPPEVILVGHSMGGTVMIEAARRLGERVVALVGVDNLQDLERKLTDEEIEGYLRHFSGDFFTATYAFVKTMFPPDTDSALVERIATQMALAPKDIALGSFENLFPYDYAAAFSEIDIPLRCINSDSYPTNVEGNKRVVGSFEVRIIPRSGHFPHLIDPINFNQHLRETIEEFWPSAAAP